MSTSLRIVQKYHPNVTKVKDARRGIKIMVTEEDCKSGRKKGPSSCAMARAFERNYDGAIISLSTAYLVKGETAYRYNVPDTVAREIVSFDRHADFAPGKYHLGPIEPARSLGKRKGPPPVRTDPSQYKKAKTKRHRTLGIRAL